MPRKRPNWLLLSLITAAGVLAVVGASVNRPTESSSRRRLPVSQLALAPIVDATPVSSNAIPPSWETVAFDEPSVGVSQEDDSTEVTPAAVVTRATDRPVVGQISFVPDQEAASAASDEPAPASTDPASPKSIGPIPTDDDLKVLTNGPYQYDPNAGEYLAGAAPVAAWPREQDCPPVPNFRCGVQCQPGGSCYEMNWKAMRPIPWQFFAQGEYVGPHRLRHVPEYRLRVDDLILLIFRLTTVPTEQPYELTVGDELQIESLNSPDVNRTIVVQPDGMISTRLLGQIYVAGRTVSDVRDDLEKRYEKYIKEPTITLTPTKLNSKLLELRATIDSRQGFGGQQREVRVTPEGTIQLPGIGSVPAQGLTLSELKREIDTRYKILVHGFEVTPVLTARAPRYIYVVGEVFKPGRYELVAPTTAMQSIALAGGWNVGGNLSHVVVFRRDDCWQLMATTLEIHLPLFGKQPCPADEIWLRDSDIVVVPKRPIKVADDAIELIFTKGIYSVFPFQYTLFQGMSTN